MKNQIKKQILFAFCTRLELRSVGHCCYYEESKNATIHMICSVSALKADLVVTTKILIHC